MFYTYTPNSQKVSKAIPCSLVLEIKTRFITNEQTLNKMIITLNTTVLINHCILNQKTTN